MGDSSRLTPKNMSTMNNEMFANTYIYFKKSYCVQLSRKMHVILTLWKKS